MHHADFEHQLRARVNRRRLLTGSAAAGGLAVVASLPGRPTRTMGAVQASPVATPTMGATPFRLGIASGDPLPDGVVLWTRLALDPINGGGMEPVPVAAFEHLASVTQPTCLSKRSRPMSPRTARWGRGGAAIAPAASAGVPGRRSVPLRG
ncbi:MAG: PhoD-like phosphatase N-terminal domain-containing protein [Thermomicrobiales bacterium]